jgi:hypothetical protein
MYTRIAYVCFKKEAAGKSLDYLMIPNQYKDIYRIIGKYTGKSSKIAH